MLPVNDTIAAISTPLFTGGIGVIRISGPDAFSIADSVFAGKKRPSVSRTHTALHGFVRDPSSGDEIDEALCLVMRGPHTYTGEDVAELSMHGSPLLLRKALDLLLERGARQAEPGEFTFRAYINGRLSLTQAEAVQQLVTARSEAGLRNAFLQLKGSLQKSIRDSREQINEIYANIEAEIEFPEEGLNFLSKEDALGRLRSLICQFEKMTESFTLGRKIEEGLKIVICGPPNSGKSTLLNRLLNEDRAIVHNLPGTTRDIVEGRMSVNGAVIRLIDTAGIRKSTEGVEEEGIRRTYRSIEEADLAVWVGEVGKTSLRSSAHLETLRSQAGLNDTGRPIIRLINKSDLLSSEERKSIQKLVNNKNEFLVSAKRGWGLGKLRKVIAGLFETIKTTGHEGLIITSSRQQQLLQAAKQALEQAAAAIAREVPPEYVCVDIRDCLDALEELTGTSPREDIYDIIFKNFCLGK